MKSFLVSLMSFLIILGYSTPVFAQINNGQAQTETCSTFSYFTISKSDSRAFLDGWRDLFTKDRALFDQLSALGSLPNPVELNVIMRATCWRYGNGSAEDFIRNIKNRTYEVTEAAQTQKEAGVYQGQRPSLKDVVKDDTAIKEGMVFKTEMGKKQAPDLDAFLDPLEQAAEREEDSKLVTSHVNEAPPAEEKTNLGAQDTVMQDMGLEPDSQVERKTEPTPLAVVQSCGNVRDHYKVDKNNLKTIPDLDEIKGVSYINSRLMTKAFESVSAISLPPEYNICAETKEEFIEPPNYIKAKVKDECGCTVERVEHSLIYVFYPLDKSQWPRGKAPQIDFEFTERVAIDGLYLTENAEFIDNPYWKDAANALIVNAHKHRAKIDLAIHVPDLTDWESKKIGSAAFKIAEEILGNRTQDRNQTRIPVLDRFLSNSLDGVTLIIGGYDGKIRRNPNFENIVELVESLNKNIEGTGRTINLAFDIDLSRDNTQKNNTQENVPDQQVDYDYDYLFDDIGDLLVDSDEREDKNNEVVSGIQPPIIDKVLIFIERPTQISTEILRSRIVRSFTGKSQSQVLRSIIPVVPPGGQKPLARIDSERKEKEVDDYGQFRADVLYSQDNFGGIGFWPAPFVTKDEDINKVKTIVRKEFDKASQKPAFEGLCKFTCLNRVLVIGVISITTVSILALVILSNFYLPIYRISYGYFAVPIMVLIIIALLTALYFCDKKSSEHSLKAIVVVLILTGAAFGFNWYNRKVSGPMP